VYAEIALAKDRVVKTVDRLGLVAAHKASGFSSGVDVLGLLAVYYSTRPDLGVGFMEATLAALGSDHGQPLLHKLYCLCHLLEYVSGACCACETLFLHTWIRAAKECPRDPMCWTISCSIFSYCCSVKAEDMATAIGVWSEETMSESENDWGCVLSACMRLLGRDPAAGVNCLVACLRGMMRARIHFTVNGPPMVTMADAWIQAAQASRTPAPVDGTEVVLRALADAYKYPAAPFCLTGTIWAWARIVHSMRTLWKTRCLPKPITNDWKIFWAAHAAKFLQSGFPWRAPGVAPVLEALAGHLPPECVEVLAAEHPESVKLAQVLQRNRQWAAGKLMRWVDQSKTL
jgi:hypothetical protein